MYLILLPPDNLCCSFDLAHVVMEASPWLFICHLYKHFTEEKKKWGGRKQISPPKATWNSNYDETDFKIFTQKENNGNRLLSMRQQKQGKQLLRLAGRQPAQAERHKRFFRQFADWLHKTYLTRSVEKTSVPGWGGSLGLWFDVLGKSRENAKAKRVREQTQPFIHWLIPVQQNYISLENKHRWNTFFCGYNPNHCSHGHFSIFSQSQVFTLSCTSCISIPIEKQGRGIETACKKTLQHLQSF